MISLFKSQAGGQVGFAKFNEAAGDTPEKLGNGAIDN